MSEWVDPAELGNGGKNHLWRYQYAREWLEPRDVVLDVACGCGYGSQLMSESCRVVHGIDKNPDALERARSNYHTPYKTHYTKVDLEFVEALPQYDVAVSFETIEHLANPQRFAGLLRASARRMIILSSPLQDVGSEYHKSSFFMESQIRDLFEDEDWVVVEAFRQAEGPYGVYRIERRK